MRRAIATRLLESKQTTPHFYLRATARVDKLLKLRSELNGVGDLRVSVNDMVIKAAAQAHTVVPAMNSIWTPDAVRTFSSVDIAIAVATETTLLTPVLHGVEHLSISAVATSARDLAERARAGRLRQDELEGGALSVTNLGMFGTEEFAAIINPPQSAILAVGAARPEPVAHKGKVSVATVMRLTLSVDHRAVDGALAAQWMTAFVQTLEKPLRILV
jgi:pyruvate dehydrogenase E2 component (dihydrolipoamide acetyltransferase)